MYRSLNELLLSDNLLFQLKEIGVLLWIFLIVVHDLAHNMRRDLVVLGDVHHELVLVEIHVGYGISRLRRNLFQRALLALGMHSRL